MIRLRVLFVVCLLLTVVGFFPLGASPVAVAAEKDKQADLLDLNTATAEQLITLPGIDEAYAEKIIQGRPYQRTDELVQRQILSRGKYEAIKYKIVAKQK
ncbi:MAG: ComEA family DNA-binding protein [Nitrospiraceae bacterium]